MIKTFRGLMVDGAIDTIVLHTNDGSTGYRIVKFELFPNTPGTASQESVVKVLKVAQTTVTGTIDFSNQEIVAAGYYHGGTGTGDSYDMITVFDQEIFNQDIYITHSEVNGSQLCNYYIELEQVKLDLGANTVATLKDIRNINP